MKASCNMNEEQSQSGASTVDTELSSDSELDQEYIAKLRDQMLNESRQKAHELIESRQRAHELDDVSSTKSSRNFRDIFTLLNRIGRGSFGDVYKCRENVTEAYYAAKMIRTTSYIVKGDADASKEIQICERLRAHAHPNIVSLIEHFSDEPDQTILIFEYISGCDLYHGICTKEKYSAVDASRFMRQIMEAVRLCHSLGVVHRDIKPTNILLSRDQTVKLIDFGLSVEIGDKSKEWHGWAGTPLFLSPEMIRFQQYGTPVDIWACGVVLYMLLFGVHPFDDTSRPDKLSLYRNIAVGRFRVPNGGDDYMSEEARQLLSGLLTVDQDERMTAAEALEHPFLKNCDAVATQFHRQITVTRMRRLNHIRVLEGVSVFHTVFPSKGLCDRVNAAQFGYLGDKPADPSADTVRVIGSARQPSDDRETAAKRTRIVQLTKWIIKAVVEFDYSTYRRLVSGDRSCSGFGTDEKWKFGLEFKDFHEDQEVIGANVLKTNIIIFNPRVHLLVDGACIAYDKIFKIVKTGEGTIHRCVQETRVWERINDLDHWHMVHIHNSRYPRDTNDIVEFRV